MLRRSIIPAIAAFAATAFAFASAAPASAQTPDEIIKRGKLVVAIDTTTPPYASLDSSNQPVGYDIDVANAIAKRMKVQLEFVTVNSPGRIPALLSNRVDMVISIFSITAERALQVQFSIPYGGQSAVLVAPKSLAVKAPAELTGMKIGVTRGALEDGALTAMAIPNMQILRFDDYPSTMQAMLSGQVDAIGGGDYGDIYLRKSAKGDDFEAKFPLRAAHFGIGTRKNATELNQWLNTFIYEIKNNGELDGISRKWRQGAPLIALPVF